MRMEADVWSALSSDGESARQERAVGDAFYASKNSGWNPNFADDHKPTYTGLKQRATAHDDVNAYGEGVTPAGDAGYYATNYNTVKSAFPSNFGYDAKRNQGSGPFSGNTQFQGAAQATHQELQQALQLQQILRLQEFNSRDSEHLQAQWLRPNASPSLYSYGTSYPAPSGFTSSGPTSQLQLVPVLHEPLALVPVSTAAHEGAVKGAQYTLNAFNHRQQGRRWHAGESHRNSHGNSHGTSNGYGKARGVEIEYAGENTEASENGDGNDSLSWSENESKGKMRGDQFANQQHGGPSRRRETDRRKAERLRRRGRRRRRSRDVSIRGVVPEAHGSGVRGVGESMDLMALSAVASSSMLSCSREFKRHFPQIHRALCKGLLDVSRLAAHEIIVPVREEVIVRRQVLRTKKGLTLTLRDQLGRVLGGKFPDAAATTQLIARVTESFYDRVEHGLQDAEDEQTFMHWLLRFDLEHAVSLRHSFVVTTHANLIITSLEGSAQIKLKKRALAADDVTLNIQLVVKALYLNAAQLAHINADPAFVRNVEQAPARSFLGFS